MIGTSNNTAQFERIEESPLELRIECNPPVKEQSPIPFDEFIKRFSTLPKKKKQVQILGKGDDFQEINETQELPQRSQTQCNFPKGILKTIVPTRVKNISQMNMVSQDRGNEDNNFSSYIRIKLKEEDDIKYDQLDSPQAFDNFLQSLLYRDIRLIGKGATTITFKAINMQNQIIAVKVQKKSEVGLQAALLYKSINQDMANNLTGHSLFQHNIVEIGDILVIEEDLANETLEDVLAKRALKGEIFQDEEIRTIIVELAEQLYLLHVIKGCAHHDIKPENILIKADHYVLSDLGVAELVENFSSLLMAKQVQEITAVVGTVLYMSPAKLDHYHYCLNNNLIEQKDKFQSYLTKNNHMPSITYNQKSLQEDESDKFYHNPFKSDIYSFGLVIMRLLLHNQNITLTIQIENIFYHNKELLMDKVRSHPFYFHPERFILYEDTLQQIKSLLEILLDSNEETRGNILDVVLMLNTSQNILISISTPHSKLFMPKIEILQDVTKVIYDVKKIIYEGSFDQEHQERAGGGIMYMTEDSFWSQSKTQGFSYHHDMRKHQTIQEEDLSLELSYLDIISQPQNLIPLKTNDKSNSILDASVQDKLILYEGEWLKNYPHGPGKLNIYKNRQSQDYTYQKNLKNRGKTIKYAPSQENQQVGLCIQSDFYYGILNGITTIQIDQAVIKKQFVMNLSSSVLTGLKQLNQNYGAYTFSFDESSLSVMGYYEPELDLQEKKIYLFDLRELKNSYINRILKSLLNCISLKLTTIKYTPDKISGLGTLDLMGTEQSQEIKITIIFSEILAIQRGYKRQTHQSTTSKTSQKKRGCCRDFFMKRNDGHSTVRQSFIIESDLSSQFNEKQETLSIIIDSIFQHVSLQNLDSLNLCFGILKPNALQRLENLSQFTKITNLNLSSSKVTDIVQVDNMLLNQVATYLKSLNLSFMVINDKTLDALIRSENLNQLQKLSIQGCSLLTSAGLSRLFLSQKMKKIITLDLSQLNPMDNKLLTQISPEQFSSLRELVISGCQNLTNEGIGKFVKSEMAKKLWQLKCENIVNQGFNFPVSEISLMHNLRELSLFKLFLLDNHNLPIFIELKKNFRLKSLNLIYAFKSKYAFDLDTVLKEFSQSQIRISISSSDDSLELCLEETLGKSHFQDFTIEMSSLKDKSPTEGSNRLIENMDQFLIDIYIKQLHLAVHLDLTKLLCKYSIDDKINVIISEVQLVDCTHLSQLNTGVLSNLILLQKNSKINNYYFVVTIQNSLKIIQLIQDFKTACNQLNLGGLILVLHSFVDDVIQMELFLLHVSDLPLNSLKVLEIQTTTLLTQDVLSSLQSLKSLQTFILNNQVMENQHILSEFDVQKKQNHFLRRKLELQLQIGTIRDSVQFISETQIDDEILKQLSQADGLQQLEKLQLRDQQILTDKGIEYVLTSHNTSLVHTLDLSNTKITGEVFFLIANSNHLKNLVNIILNDCNNIQFKQFQNFVPSQTAQKLKTLELTSSKINTVDQFFMMTQLRGLEKIKIIFLHQKEEHLTNLEEIYSKKLNDLYCLHLDFSQTQCERIPEIVRALKNPKLTMILLDISRNNNIDAVMQQIFSCFMRLKQSLEEFSINISETNFNIENNNFGQQFKDFIQKNSELRYLQFNYSKSEDQLKGPKRNIESENQFLQQITYSIVQLKNSLLVLDVSLERSQTISRQSVAIFCQSLKSFTQIQKFKLSVNYCKNLDLLDFQTLMTVFSGWLNIKKIYLELSHTQIQDENVQSMLEFVQAQEVANTQFRKLTLNLESCLNIRNAFKQYIHQSKKSKQTIKTVQIHLFLKKTNISELDLQSMILIRHFQFFDTSRIK